MPPPPAPIETAPVSPLPAVPASPPPPRAASGGKPAWMRNRVFRFFSSVRLAVVLLSVLIVGSIAGTLYETSFDAKVARAYIYNAWWFDVWLTLLCTNLACAAFSRWPWRRHHTGFLITHLGIITLLIGAMIGRQWGIEGTITLFKGQPPDNQLVVDQRVLRVEEADGQGEAQQYPVEIIGRRPTRARPWSLGRTAQGWDLALIDYAPVLDAKFNPEPVPPGTPGAALAVRVKLTSKRLKQSMDQWLLAGDTDHGTIDLGLATVQLRRGIAPEVTAGDAAAGAKATPATAVTGGQTVDERIIAFALKPGQQVAEPTKQGAASGATVRLQVDPAAASGRKTVLVDWRGATWNFDVDADRGHDQDLSGSGLEVTIENYWPDFVLQDNQPANASDQPHNPAVLVHLHGHLAPAPADPDAGAVAGTPAATGNSGAPSIGTAADNQAVVYCDDAGGLTFSLKSSALPAPMRGTLMPGKAINTGWADWQIEAGETLPAAVPRTEFQPVKDAPATTDDRSATSGDPNLVGNGGGGPMMGGGGNGNQTSGVLVRLSKGGTVMDQWAAGGWAVTLATTPRPTRLEYDYRIEALPIGLQLQNFEVTFNEGTDNPASFRSYLKVTGADGATGTGSCSMNHPFNFPGSLWNTFTGLTFKMSQASWNPQNLDQSVVQILRDPGWLFKWIGSLLICSGIFTLFYLRPPRPMGR